MDIRSFRKSSSRFLFLCAVFAVLVCGVSGSAKASEWAGLQFESVMRITNTVSSGLTTAGGGFGLRSVFGIVDPLVGIIEGGVGLRSRGVDEEYRGTEEMIFWGATLVGLKQHGGVIRCLLRGEFTSVDPVSWVGAEIDAYLFFFGMATAPMDLDAWKLDWGFLVRF